MVRALNTPNLRVRPNFLETVDPRNAYYAGVVVDRERVALASVDFFSVQEPDYEHCCAPYLLIWCK
jgi:hypothetical protein